MMIITRRSELLVELKILMMQIQIQVLAILVCRIVESILQAMFWPNIAAHELTDF